ncbi:MAG: hypothetical protein IJX81_04945 [Clostridia bacterium]|nr:hypothetical protein [Clostridia bacterium]
MKTIVLTEKENREGSVLLLGGFDGVHVGHRRLLTRALSLSRPVGFMTILGGKGDVLFTATERAQIFARLGADFVFETRFEEIKDVGAEEFLALLEEKFSPAAYVCGDDFRFGKGASGDVHTLQERAGRSTFVEELLKIDGEKVSATKIKALLSAGKVEAANALLCGDFFLTGKVESGRKVGRTIGFPTANIRYPKEKFPIKQGVYRTEVTTCGVAYRGITNFGGRPTFGNDEVWTETCLLGFSGDLYGKTLTVVFKEYLRDIKKFDGAEQLKKQLTEDMEYVANH